MSDTLAIDRTRLAAERTFSAWVRTGLAALVSGAGAHSVLAEILPLLIDRTIATVLLMCAVFCFTAGAWRELLATRSWPKSDLALISPAVLCIVSGALVASTLVVLVGVWTVR